MPTVQQQFIYLVLKHTGTIKTNRVLSLPPLLWRYKFLFLLNRDFAGWWELKPWRAVYCFQGASFPCFQLGVPFMLSSINNCCIIQHGTTIFFFIHMFDLFYSPKKQSQQTMHIVYIFNIFDIFNASGIKCYLVLPAFSVIEADHSLNAKATTIFSIFQTELFLAIISHGCSSDQTDHAIAHRVMDQWSILHAPVRGS